MQQSVFSAGPCVRYQQLIVTRDVYHAESCVIEAFTYTPLLGSSCNNMQCPTSWQEKGDRADAHVTTIQLQNKDHIVSLTAQQLSHNSNKLMFADACTTINNSQANIPRTGLLLPGVVWIGSVGLGVAAGIVHIGSVGLGVAAGVVQIGSVGLGVAAGVVQIGSVGLGVAAATAMSQ